MWTFSLACVTPSLNEIQGWHWSHARTAKKALKVYVAAGLNAVPKIPLATGKRRLTIVRHGHGSLDKANLVGGVKWLEDEIKVRGLLVDDRDEFCELVVSQVVSRKAPLRTVVTLEDLDGQ